MVDLSRIRRFLTATRGHHGADWVDVLSYAYLMLGLLIILLPVFWMFMSSLKSDGSLLANDPRLLPYDQMHLSIEGYQKPLSLFYLESAAGIREEVAFVRAKGSKAVVIRPDAPAQQFEVERSLLVEKEIVKAHWENYTDPTVKTSLDVFNFPRYFFNSVFVTSTATILTLLINAMAAFALSKYRFPGRNAAVLIIISTLLIPPTVILVPLFIVVKYFGMFNSLWGVIIPGAATPTGVFLLRQYMLTIPDELLEAARMDAASEWKIFWRIVFPLSLPAIAVLAILSVIWRWNDFLWPLIVLTKSEVYTLQIGLSTFKGELSDNIHYLLAMTVLTLLPVTAVFAFLQKYITTGIANTGMK